MTTTPLDESLRRAKPPRRAELKPRRGLERPRVNRLLESGKLPWLGGRGRPLRGWCGWEGFNVSDLGFFRKILDLFCWED